MRTKSDRKRKLIVVGGILAASIVLASAFLVGSGAVFTTTSANPSNVFTAGVLTQSNSEDATAILTASLMKPFDVKSGTVTIQNTGDIAGDFTLSMTKTADVPGANAGHLYDILDLTVTDAGNPVPVYDGDLKDFVSADLGTYDAGESHTYTFTVTFPNGGMPSGNTTGDNIYQGSTTTVEFDWTAVQS